MAKQKMEDENGQQRINKMELVRQALATLGNETSPRELVRHLKDQANLDISVNMVSNYKSTILKKLGVPSGRRGRRAAGQSLPGSTARSERISLTDLRTLREMVERLGMSRLREVVEILD